MRITLTIASLATGGAERVLSLLAGHWAKDHDVTLVTVGTGATDTQDLPREVDRVDLGLGGESGNVITGLFRNVRRVRALSQAIRRSNPDVVLSFMNRTNIRTLLASIGHDIPVIIAEHNHPDLYPNPRIWRVLKRWIYPRAAALVVLTEDMATWARRVVPSDRVHRIPNPIAHPGETTPPRPDALPEGPVAVGLGNLVRQKGFDRLLDAFSRISDEHPGWSLAVCGTGPLQDALEAQREDLGLEDRVNLPGFVEDPDAIFAHADLFVLPSRYEGFPIVLLEAMARGLPPVAFACRSGPDEIIRDGVDGVLVSQHDVAGLAEAMAGLMGDAKRRKMLGGRASEVTDRFGLERIGVMWEDLFTEVRN